MSKKKTPIPPEISVRTLSASMQSFTTETGCRVFVTQFLKRSFMSSPYSHIWEAEFKSGKIAKRKTAVQYRILFDSIEKLVSTKLLEGREFSEVEIIRSGNNSAVFYEDVNKKYTYHLLISKRGMVIDFDFTINSINPFNTDFLVERAKLIFPYLKRHIEDFIQS